MSETEIDNVAVFEAEQPVVCATAEPGTEAVAVPPLLRRATSIARLSPEQLRLLLAYRECNGDRIKACAQVHGYDLSDPEQREKARLASFAFTRGSLGDVLDELAGVSLQDKVLIAVEQAIRSKKLTMSRVRALERLAVLAGLLDGGTGAKQAQA